MPIDGDDVAGVVALNVLHQFLDDRLALFFERALSLVKENVIPKHDAAGLRIGADAGSDLLCRDHHFGNFSQALFKFLIHSRKGISLGGHRIQISLKTFNPGRTSLQLGSPIKSCDLGILETLFHIRVDPIGTLQLAYSILVLDVRDTGTEQSRDDEKAQNPEHPGNRCPRVGETVEVIHKNFLSQAAPGNDRQGISAERQVALPVTQSMPPDIHSRKTRYEKGSCRKIPLQMQ